MPGFTPSVVAALHQSKILGIRVGREHRFTGVWPVVVEGRLFARSYEQRPGGWYKSLKSGAAVWIEIHGRPVAARAVPARGERLNAAVDAAYREKYNTPGSLKYVRGFKHPKRRKTTTEFVPAHKVAKQVKVVFRS